MNARHNLVAPDHDLEFGQRRGPLLRPRHPGSGGQRILGLRQRRRQLSPEALKKRNMGKIPLLVRVNALDGARGVSLAIDGYARTMRRTAFCSVVLTSLCVSVEAAISSRSKA